MSREAILCLLATIVVRFWLVNSATVPANDGFVKARYRTNGEISVLLNQLAVRHPTLAKVHVIGQSVEGRELLVIQISDNVHNRGLLEPKFKYVANIHGNEVLGRELLLNLAQYLLENYGKDPVVTQLVDSTDIYLMPTMNPDGFNRSKVGDCSSVTGRHNVNSVDLNRDFPDDFFYDEPHEVQQETQAMMDWIAQDPNFVLSANLHGGALVVSYPYDSAQPGNPQDEYSKSPDDDVFLDLALTYSLSHTTMHTGRECAGDHFPRGVTNGAQWYSIHGGMQDYNYLHSNCFEVTIELGCCKYPPPDELPVIWQQNKRSLLAYMAKVHQGVKGLIRHANGTSIDNALIRVDGINHDIKSSSKGEYWRLLVAGSYTMKVVVPGYPIATTNVQVLLDEVTEVNFTLHRTGWTIETENEAAK